VPVGLVAPVVWVAPVLTPVRFRMAAVVVTPAPVVSVVLVGLRVGCRCSAVPVVSVVMPVWPVGVLPVSRVRRVCRAAPMVVLVVLVVWVAPVLMVVPVVPAVSVVVSRVRRVRAAPGRWAVTAVTVGRGSTRRGSLMAAGAVTPVLVVLVVLVAVRVRVRWPVAAVLVVMPGSPGTVLRVLRVRRAPRAALMAGSVRRVVRAVTVPVVVPVALVGWLVSVVSVVRSGCPGRTPPVVTAAPAVLVGWGLMPVLSAMAAGVVTPVAVALVVWAGRPAATWLWVVTVVTVVMPGPRVRVRSGSVVRRAPRAALMVRSAGPAAPVVPGVPGVPVVRLVPGVWSRVWPVRAAMVVSVVRAARVGRGLTPVL
jgi:hypothetical protein